MELENLKRIIENKFKEGMDVDEVKKIPMIANQDFERVNKAIREVLDCPTEQEVRLKKAERNYTSHFARERKRSENLKKIERERLYQNKVYFRVTDEDYNKLHSYGWGYRAECCRQGLKLFFEREAKREKEAQKQREEEERGFYG